MTQYCRYCNNLVTGNGIYCEVLCRELPERYCKHPTRCKQYEFNQIDAFGENPRPYRPRVRKEEKSEVEETKGEQISMF